MSGFLDYPLVPDWYKNGGGIHIKPSKRGTFTKAAKRRGLTVKEFADRVLSNKGKYSSAMVKKANFARNASKWHAEGGPIDYSGIVTTNNRPYNVDYIAYIDKALRKGGMNPMQRASVLANIIEESGGDPFAEGPGGFYGLVQWSGDRYKKTGEKDAYKEIDNQVKTILETAGNSTDRISWTHGGKGSGYNSFKDAMDAYNGDDLAGVMRGYTLGYVRPAGGVSSYNNRLKVAEQIYGLDGFGNFDAGGFINKYGEKRVKAALDRLYAKGGPLKSNYNLSALIVTPDKEYSQFLNTLPDNQKFTPESEYSTRKYWELNGKPKDFEEAKKLGMYVYDSSDNSYHANSIAWGEDGIGYFMKPKHHDTVKYELDWFNNGIVTEEGGRQHKAFGDELKEWKEFRKNYDIDTTGDFYRYIPRKHKHDKGGHLFVDGGDGGTPVYRYVGKDRSIWSPEEISQIQAQAIQNPGRFWSDDGSNMRQSMYNAGLDSIVQSIWDETPEDVRLSVPESALPNSVRSKQYQRGVTNAVDRAGNATFNLLDTATAFMPGPVGTANWLAHMGADALSGNYGKLGLDAGMVAGMGLGMKGLGKGFSWLASKSNKLQKASQNVADFLGNISFNAADTPTDAGVARLMGKERGFLRDVAKDFGTHVSNTQLDSSLPTYVRSAPAPNFLPIGWPSSSDASLSRVTSFNPGTEYSAVSAGNFASDVASEISRGKWGNLKFIRNARGIPKMNHDGTFNVVDNSLELGNFTYDLPFRPHKKYSTLPGTEYYLISPEAFRGKTPMSIEPMDTFFLHEDIGGIDPRHISVVTGDPSAISAAKTAGLRYVTSDELQRLGSKIRKELDALDFSDPLVKRGSHLYDNITDDLVSAYRNEADKVITGLGRPTMRDVMQLEEYTNLDSGVRPASELSIARKAIGHPYTMNEARALKDPTIYRYGNGRDVNVMHAPSETVRMLTEEQVGNLFYDYAPYVDSDFLRSFGRYGGAEYDPMLTDAIRDKVLSNPDGYHYRALDLGKNMFINPKPLKTFGGQIRRKGR